MGGRAVKNLKREKSFLILDVVLAEWYIFVALTSTNRAESYGIIDKVTEPKTNGNGE
ncbi:MAG: hypothetical protein HYT94_01595 [Parcubacteria group bacterium]|nr:hypothetical protein [Parcubacteria group bacterium]